MRKPRVKDVEQWFGNQLGYPAGIAGKAAFYKISFVGQQWCCQIADSAIGVRINIAIEENDQLIGGFGNTIFHGNSLPACLADYYLGTSFLSYFNRIIFRLVIYHNDLRYQRKLLAKADYIANCF